MSQRVLTLRLRGFGTPVTDAQVHVKSLSSGERARRAAMAPVIGLAVSLLVLPIPIVHFAVPPVALLGGVAMGIRRALQGEIFIQANGPCPYCGTAQGLGLSGTAFRLPRNLKCRACLKLFTIGET